MSSRLCFLALASLLNCLPVSLVRAATVDIVAAKDSALYEYGEDETPLANGQGDFLFVGFTLQNSDTGRRSLMAFDVASAIPAGSVITSAELRLVVTKSNGGNPVVGVHRVTSAWSEGLSNPSGQEGAGANAINADLLQHKPGDSTWLYSEIAVTRWSNAGGDYVGLASATSTIADANPVWSGVGMVADVQHWLDSPSQNFGWILVSDTVEAGTVRQLLSAQSPDPLNRPTLHVEFTAVPLPPAALLFLSGGWMLFLRRRIASLRH